MSLTVTWQVYAGATPAWTDIGAGERLVFAGSDRNLAIPIRTKEWQAGTHLGSACPGIDKCGKNHVPNVKYVDDTHFDSGSGSEAINDTNLADTECTLRIKVVDDSGLDFKLSDCYFYVYDVFAASRYAPNIQVMAFERGVSATSWTEINDGSSSGGNGASDRLDLGDKASLASTQYFYVALSASPIEDDTLPILNFGFHVGSAEVQTQVDASARDAYEQVTSGDTSITDTELNPNYSNSDTDYTALGFKFPALSVPNGATIEDARLSVYTLAEVANDCTVDIAAELSAAPADYSAGAANDDITGRSYSTNGVYTNLNNFLTNAWVELDADLSPTLQDLVDLVAWTDGDPAALKMESEQETTRQRRIYAYDQDPQYGAKLNVKYAVDSDESLDGRLTHCSGDPDYEVWVLDSSGYRRALIDDLNTVEWDLAVSGETSLTLSCNYSTHARTALNTYDYILLKRGHGELIFAEILKPKFKITPAGLGEATIQIECRDMSHLLEQRRILPDTASGDDTMSYTGRPDDAMKYMVQNNFETGYADAARVWTGFTTQPARAEADLPTDPDEREFQGDWTTDVWAFCNELAGKYDVDFKVRSDGAGATSFDTYSPRYGIDRSSGNADGNREVVLTVNRENIIDIESHNDKTEVRNFWYIGGFGEGADRLIVTVSDSDSISTYGRREAWLDMGGCANENLMEQNGRIELSIYGEPVTGIKVQFQQSEALKFQRDFMVGDYVSVYFQPFDVDLGDDWEVTRVKGILASNGQESLEVDLGRVEPSLLDWMDKQKRQGGRGGHGAPSDGVTTIHPQDTMDEGTDNSYALTDHVHGAQALAPSGNTGLATTGSAGSSGYFVHSNHEHPAFDDNVTPSNIAGSAATGTNAHAARLDHVHACTRYSHTHTASGSVDSEGHTHTMLSHRHHNAFCAELAGYTQTVDGHSHSLYPADSSASATINDKSNYVTTNLLSSDGSHTHGVSGLTISTPV